MLKNGSDFVFSIVDPIIPLLNFMFGRCRMTAECTSTQLLCDPTAFSCRQHICLNSRGGGKHQTSALVLSAEDVA